MLAAFPVVESFNVVIQNTLGKGKVITGSNYEDILKLWTNNQELFVSELGGQLVRRKHNNGHIYFLSMLSNNPVDGWVSLGVHARSAVLFDPMSGAKGKAKLRNNEAKTEVYLQLKPGESILIKTFNKEVESAEWNYVTPTKERVELKNDWTLRFPESDPAIDETFRLNELTS